MRDSKDQPEGKYQLLQASVDILGKSAQAGYRYIFKTNSFIRNLPFGVRLIGKQRPRMPKGSAAVSGGVHGL